jgi:hypothetical protein
LERSSTCFLRGSYVRLYSRFGVKPEEAGVDYFAVLTSVTRLLRAGNLRIRDNALVTTIIELVIIVAVGWIFWRRVGKRLSLPQYLLAYFAFLLVAAFLVLSWQVGIDVDQAYQRTVAGQRVRPGDLDFVSFQAYRCELNWVSDKPLPERLSSSGPFMCLGSTEGKAIIVNLKEHPHRTLKLDEQLILIVLNPCYKDEKYKSDCDS